MKGVPPQAALGLPSDGAGACADQNYGTGGIHDGRFWRSFPPGGFLTSAAENGASVFRMMDVSWHKSVETVRGYVRRAEGFTDHAGNGLL
jgi:hypothetical protein